MFKPGTSHVDPSMGQCIVGFSWGFDGDNVKMGCEMGYHGITDTTGCTGIQPDNGIQGDVYIYIYKHLCTLCNDEHDMK